MSWAGISSNQCVSCNNLQDAVNTGVFTLKNTIPVSTKQITKAEAENYVYINSISGKTSNQLVVKSNLTSSTTGNIFLISGDGSSFPSPQATYKSSDGGTSWSALSAAPNPAILSYINVSPNGQYIIMFSFSSLDIISSSNSGASFVTKYVGNFLQRVFLSDNGTYFFSLETGSTTGRLLRSTDYGANFSAVITNSVSDTNFNCGAVSGDGNIVVLYRYYYLSPGTGQLYNGSSGTGTWESSFPSVMSSKQVIANAMSYTGQYSLAVTYDGYLLVNNNGFAYNAWTAISKTHQMVSCDVSYSGAYMIAGTWNGYVYASTDYGATWYETNFGSTNMYVAVSSNGLFSVISSSRTGDVYTSTTGAIWSQKTTTPNLSANSVYTGIAM